MMQVVCAVEVGWRGMRECSTALGRSGAAVEVLIKGEVEPAVLGMITRRPGVTIRAVAARRFVWTLARRLIAPIGKGGERLLIVNKPKTQRWTRWVGRLRGWRVWRLEETPTGYRLFDDTGRETSVPATEPGYPAPKAMGGRQESQRRESLGPETPVGAEGTSATAPASPPVGGPA